MKEEEAEEIGRRLMEALADVPDPRRARSLYAIAQWGREHPELAQVLGFSRERTPCVATLHHVFRRLDMDAFEGALSGWAQGALKEGDKAIAVDGKALRGIHGDELPGVRLVAAYAHRSGLVLGQKGGKGSRQGE